MEDMYNAGVLHAGYAEFAVWRLIRAGARGQLAGERTFQSVQSTASRLRAVREPECGVGPTLTLVPRTLVEAMSEEAQMVVDRTAEIARMVGCADMAKVHAVDVNGYHGPMERSARRLLYGWAPPEDN